MHAYAFCAADRWQSAVFLAQFEPGIASFQLEMDLLRIIGYNRCEVRQICNQKNFSKKFVAIGKKRDSGAHILWGESIARGDEYGKMQPV